MDDSFIDAFVDRLDDSGHLLFTDRDADAMWHEIAGCGLSPFDRQRFFASLRIQLMASGHQLNMIEGGWEISLSTGAVKAMLATSLLCVGLISSGFTPISPVVLPAIVPLLFEIRQVRLTMKERQIWISLSVKDDVINSKMSIRELYVQLSDELRQQITELDFHDFVEKCVRAGLADRDLKREYTFHTAADRKFRISFA